MRPSIADLIGIKYKQNGKSKTEGFDCYEFVREVERRYGHTMPEVCYEGSFAKAFRDSSECVVTGSKLRRTGSPNFGDIILFLDGNGNGIHIGVWLDDGRFAHCDKEGSHVSRLSTYTSWNAWRFYTW